MNALLLAIIQFQLIQPLQYQKNYSLKSGAELNESTALQKSASFNISRQTFLPHLQIPSGTGKATLVLILVFLMLHLISHLCHCSHNNVWAPNPETREDIPRSVQNLAVRCGYIWSRSRQRGVPQAPGRPQGTASKIKFLPTLLGHCWLINW